MKMLAPNCSFKLQDLSIWSFQSVSLVDEGIFEMYHDIVHWMECLYQLFFTCIIIFVFLPFYPLKEKIVFCVYKSIILMNNMLHDNRWWWLEKVFHFIHYINHGWHLILHHYASTNFSPHLTNHPSRGGDGFEHA